MKKVILPDETTYIAVFLTLRCCFSCSYCINRHDELSPRKELSAKEWINGLNHLVLKRETMTPITFQGGEPGIHKGFVEIIKNLDPNFYIDMLTNLNFDIDYFMKEIPPERLQRDVPYASIRVSYHPEYSDPDSLLKKIVKMQKNGYSIGLFAVDHPETNIEWIRRRAEEEGIDFRTKEYLGSYKGKLYGRYLYPDAVNGNDLKQVLCQSTEILISPDGSIHKCHRDLYHGEYPLANILDEDLSISFPFRDCHKYGECSPCDVKIKNNRFQQFGSCSVKIKEINSYDQSAVSF